MMKGAERTSQGKEERRGEARRGIAG